MKLSELNKVGAVMQMSDDYSDNDLEPGEEQRTMSAPLAGRPLTAERETEWTVPLRDVPEAAFDPDFEDTKCPFCDVRVEEEEGNNGLADGDGWDTYQSHCPKCQRHYEMDVPYETVIRYYDATLRLVAKTQAEWPTFPDPTNEEADDTSNCPLCNGQLEIGDDFSTGRWRTVRTNCAECGQEFGWTTKVSEKDDPKQRVVGTLELEPSDEAADEIEEGEE
jgi:hypothetical protein